MEEIQCLRDFYRRSQNIFFQIFRGEKLRDKVIQELRSLNDSCALEEGSWWNYVIRSACQRETDWRLTYKLTKFEMATKACQGPEKKKKMQDLLYSVPSL